MDQYKTIAATNSTRNKLMSFFVLRLSLSILSFLFEEALNSDFNPGTATSSVFGDGRSSAKQTPCTVPNRFTNSRER